MTHPGKLRVFHVDDDAGARKLMSILIELEPDLEEAGCARDVGGLLQALEQARPDVLVMDLTMNGKDPIDAIRTAKDAHPELRVVVLSGQCDPRVLARARSAGAETCLPKAAGVDETIAAIRGRVLR